MPFKTISPKNSIFYFACFFSVVAKIYVASFGHKFDMESWGIIGEIILSGKSVYANTERYNYGPIWFLVIGFFAKIQQLFSLATGDETLHMLLAFFLGLVDVAAAFVAKRAFGFKVALLFALNPLSILVSGYLVQFDQLAVLLGLVGVIFLKHHLEKRRPILFWGAVAFFALSLVAKHVLFLWPIWAAYFLLRRGRQHYLEAAVVLLLPPILFLISFAPWAFDPASRVGIWRNVFMYRSAFGEAPFAKILALMVEFGRWYELLVGMVWMLGLFFSAYIFRAKSLVEYFLLYLVAVVCFSPSIWGQYLVIPLLACAYFFRYRSIQVYLFITFLYLFLFTGYSISQGDPPAVWLWLSRYWPRDQVDFVRYLSVPFLILFLFIQMYKARVESSVSRE